MSGKAITLLSSLGMGDASVSIAKAMLLQYVPGASIVDITHCVAEHDLQQAAYLLLSAYRHFPAGTVHILPVGVFSGRPQMLLAEKNNHYFIAPDNGLLSLAFGERVTVRVCNEFGTTYFFSDWIHGAARTAAAVYAGDTTAFSLYAMQDVPRLQPKMLRDGIDCNVLYVDRFENVVLDITRQQFEELVDQKPFRVRMMRGNDITSLSNNYNDVPVHQSLCRFNNAGFLEIALNHGKAAALLGLSTDNTANLRYQRVKIFC